MGSENTKELAKSQFGREASKYVTSLIHSSTDDLEFVRELIDPKSTWQVLDIATGAGHLAITLSPYVDHVIASDITPEMLIEAEKLLEEKNIDNIDLANIDVHKIPYRDNRFDLVTSRIAPHHFHDIDLAMGEMVRVTKPGGYVFIEDTVAPEDESAATIFNRIEKLRDPSHVRDLSPSEWVTLLKSKGCQLVSHTLKMKHWPLRWWTERMSAPDENVNQILDILENINEAHKDEIHITRQNPNSLAEDPHPLDQWSIYPNNGYFLARKKE